MSWSLLPSSDGKESEEGDQVKGSKEVQGEGFTGPCWSPIPNPSLPFPWISRDPFPPIHSWKSVGREGSIDSRDGNHAMDPMEDKKTAFPTRRESEREAGQVRASPP